MVINEFIAYAHLGPLKASLDPVSFTIATFALCGFANLSSVGIQIGGIGALAPNRKHDLAKLGFRAMIAGTLANFLSATLAGLPFWPRRPPPAKKRSAPPPTRGPPGPENARPP